VAKPRLHGARSLEITPHPSPRLADRVELVRWRRAPDRDKEAPVYECRMKLPGEAKWGPFFSLRTADRADAAVRAAEAYGERLAGGAPPVRRRAAAATTTTATAAVEQPAAAVGGRTFADAAEAVIKALEEKMEEAHRRHRHRRSGEANKHATRISSLRKHLVPAFGAKDIAAITQRQVDEWLKNYRVEGRRGKGGKRPAANTVGNWNAAFRMVFDHAVAEGWVDHKLSLSKTGLDGPENRPWFAPSEVEAIRDYLPGWVARGGGRINDGGVSSDVRYLLHAYVAVASCTGVRPGEEMELIRPSQIHFEKGFCYITVPTRKGRGKEERDRDAVIFEDDHFNGIGLLRDLLAWRKERGCSPHSPLFSLPQTGECPDFDDPFRRLLTEMDLRIDPETAHKPHPKERCLYSLRHYFATVALLRGESIDDVALWMGTSVAMIEKTYRKVLLRMKGAKLARLKDGPHRMAVLLRRQTAEERASPNYIPGADDQPDMPHDAEWWRDLRE
jgi:integrase